jgi:paired amphipathic helix protein Sin3a
LHKSEEERHEYHIHIEALTRTIVILDPINFRLEEMPPEERASFKLKPDFGGSGKSIYHRTIKRVYGRENGLEVINALQECPVVAVPVVLARLKQKDEEWRRLQREWSRTWREVDAKNFYKSLDHQGISFKANDKKNITAKHFVADIELRKETQLHDQEASIPASQAFARGSVGHQLEFPFQDTSVLHDSLKMVFSFLDHSQALYGPQERRTLEKFFRSFIPALLMCPAAEFNAGCGALEGGHDDELTIDTCTPLDSQRQGRRSSGTPQGTGSNIAGVPASDLRKKLLKTVQDKTNRKDGEPVSRVGSRTPSPASRVGSPSIFEGHSGVLAAPETAKDVWLREAQGGYAAGNPGNGVHKLERRPFFANTTFYTLLRLLQVNF